jgi:magnesium transporter
MRTLSFQGVTWHDDPSPTEKELLTLQQKYGFHDLDIEDCLSEHERPKVEEYDAYLFLVFHIPYKSPQSGRILKEEINVFLGQDFVITLHEGKIPTLDRLWRELNESHVKREESLQHGTGYFLYELMRLLFQQGFPLVDSITKELRRMEDELFETEEEVDILRDLITLNRNIITMRSILLPQRTIVASLEHKNRKFVSEELALYYDDIRDAIERQWSLLETAKEVIEALQYTHRAWLNHKTNEVIRILTVFSVTMLPLSVLTGLWGMNVGLPFQEHVLAFEIILAIMAGTLVGMLAYFARKRWL